MPSPALKAWTTESTEALAHLEIVAANLSDARQGEQQILYAYVLLLCAHFQAYCRGLHSDATQVLVDSIEPGVGSVLDVNLSFARQLDRRNAQPGTLGIDFNRFGVAFWSVVQTTDVRNAERRVELEHLHAWRNAIAHHDIESRRGELAPPEVTHSACRSWRDALDGLAGTFDRIIAERLQMLVGHCPW